ncbi:MAG: hypothetical protein R2792_15120 [Saprospiraceae bacterium]
MEKSIAVYNIISLPEQFYNPENKRSAAELLKGSGFFEFCNEIGQNEIEHFLRESPNLIDRWLEWSGDKRTDSGWYFDLDANHRYVVGFVSSQNTRIAPMIFSDKYVACATYIYREIASISEGAL